MSGAYPFLVLWDDILVTYERHICGADMRSIETGLFWTTEVWFRA